MSKTISQECQVAGIENARMDIVARDLAERSADIAWPENFNPETAGYFSHNAVLIEAPREVVWTVFTKAKSWPDWFFLCKEIAFENGHEVLAEGVKFRWITASAQVESFVHTFVPGKLISWFGASPGTPPSVYHAWHFSSVGDACYAVYDEVVTGATAAFEREKRTGRLHQSHDLWLAALKWISEETAYEKR